MLRKAAGVKQEEMDWLGVEGWLKGQKGSVTRNDLMDYIKANQIELEEVQKGGLSDADVAKKSAMQDQQVDLQSQIDLIERLSDEQVLDVIRRTFPTVKDEVIKEGNNRSNANAMAQVVLRREFSELGDEIAAMDQGRSAVKFTEWQMPGGKNYKELLMRLPPGKGSEIEISDQIAAMNKRLRKKYGENYVALMNDQEKANEQSLMNEMERREGNAPLYKSGHFDETNVLAHVRFNERTDADGKRVLLIEEIQSDWMQQTRKEKAKIAEAVDSDFDAIAARMVEAGIIQKDCD